MNNDKCIPSIFVIKPPRLGERCQRLARPSGILSSENPYLAGQSEQSNAGWPAGLAINIVGMYICQGRKNDCWLKNVLHPMLS